MPNSGNPLAVGEDLLVNCELGLDEEIIGFIRESHEFQMRIGGEPFYFWTRIDAGELISKSITSWYTTAPQYSAYIWQPADGDLYHPNARIQQDKFDVFHNSVKMTRVFDPDSIAYDSEYAIVIDPGTDSSDKGSVRIWFNSAFTPVNVSYSYRNICSCVDSTTGYPNRECPLCRGTSYPAAFKQYTTDATKYKPANTIVVRVPMVAESLTPEQVGRVIRRDTRLWMQRQPVVNNFDLIMGTTGRNEGVLFEITSKSDSRIRGIMMHQEFQVIRLEETDIRYKLAPLTVAARTNELVAITSSAEIS